MPSAVLVLVAACGPAPQVQHAPPPPKPATIDEACDRYQQLYCDRLDECSHFLLRAIHGDMGKCRARGKVHCLQEIAPASSGVNEAWLQACATATRTAACNALFDGVASCKQPPGKLPPSAACSADAQCSSLLCAIDAGAQCGRCASQAKDGEACPASGCGVGRACVAGACANLAPLGGACTGHDGCAGWRRCNAGKCDGGALSGECDPAGKTAPDCSLAEGLVCDAPSKVCRPAKIVIVSGASCSALQPCSGALRCGASKLCVSPFPDGAECGEGERRCELPARCVDERCVLPDSAVCK